LFGTGEIHFAPLCITLLIMKALHCSLLRMLYPTQI
jgi:hypothetical protein